MLRESFVVDVWSSAEGGILVVDHVVGGSRPLLWLDVWFSIRSGCEHGAVRISKNVLCGYDHIPRI